MEAVTTRCPECGCGKYSDENQLGEGYRVCTDCGQEWWTDIDYTEGQSKKTETQKKGMYLWRIADIFIGHDMLDIGETGTFCEDGTFNPKSYIMQCRRCLKTVTVSERETK